MNEGSRQIDSLLEHEASLMKITCQEEVYNTCLEKKKIGLSFYMKTVVIN